MRISDWSSDVCSSDLPEARVLDAFAGTGALGLEALSRGAAQAVFMENYAPAIEICRANIRNLGEEARATILACDVLHPHRAPAPCDIVRSAEHTPELQSLMRNSYAVFCLQKNITTTRIYQRNNIQ